MAKAFEINLTPQNDEWIKLIPNAGVNTDIIMNKLIEMSINEGLLLEVISQSLTVTDLAKFRNTYAKMQAKRAEYMAELDVTPTHVERKRVVQTQTVEVEQEEIIPEEIPAPKPKAQAKPAKEKKFSHGFAEDSF